MKITDLSVLALACLHAVATHAEVNKPEQVAPGVWFHEGDIGRKGHCNNGWIVFKDYVLVVDANFPSGAKEVIPKIHAATGNPIRFAFDTHHHGDHAYGNQIWADVGATLVAHEGVVTEMKKYETGYYGSTPGRWEDAAKGRDDVRQSRLQPPSLLFPKSMAFDDGNHRVELHWLGVAHTHGDGFAWLPKDRVLFTGDACVNGPYNYMNDGNAVEWITTLEAARAFNPRIVCPGHGAVGGVEILDNQIAFLKTLVAEVRKLRDAGKSGAEVKAATESIKAAVKSNEKIAPYVGGGFASQVEKVWIDLGGKPFQSAATVPAIPSSRGTARRPASENDVLVANR